MTVGAVTSEPATVSVFPRSPCIFAIDGSGCGQPIALNYSPDGKPNLISPENLAQPRDDISICFTGYGIVRNQPADGYPSDKTLIQGGLTGLVVVLGQKMRVVTASYIGKEPGLVGVDQVRFQIPADAPEGCSVPFRILTSPLTRSLTA